MLGSSSASAAGQFALDMAGLDRMAAGARSGEREATRAAAQQFEALFLHQVVKGMRSTVPTSELTNSRETEFYQSLLDQQWAQVMAERGVGLADALVEQLEGRGQAPTADEGESGDRLDGQVQLAALEATPFAEIPRGKPIPLESFARARPVPDQAPSGAGAAGRSRQGKSELVTPSRPASVQPTEPKGPTGRGFAVDEAPKSFIESLSGQSSGPLIGLSDGSTGALVDLKSASSGSLLPGWGPSPGGLLQGWGVSAPTPAGTPSAKEPVELDAGVRTEGRGGHQEAFLVPLVKPALAASRRTGVPAELILAQAALETGWGRYQIQTADGSNSHNLFGIKAGRRWDGQTTEIPTHEYVSGKRVRISDRFRVYPSYEAAFTDYARLIGNSERYAPVTEAETPQQAARLLQAGGYATDPAYADKLIAIMRRIGPLVQPAHGASLRRD